MKIRKLFLTTVLLSVLAFPGLAPQHLQADGIVDSIVKAPIVPDGNVAGAATDLVINLNPSDGLLSDFFDPSVAGRSLLQGRTIKVVLPDDFVVDPAFPVATIFSSATCTPGNVQCNTGILVQGRPQNPIRPISPTDGSAVYSLTLEGNTFVHTADVDVVPGLPPAGPGIKQIHLITPGVKNPPAGSYEIQVIAETGPNGEVETGSAIVEILPSIQPSINITSVFNPGSPNTIYQNADRGELTPFAHDFYLWDAQGLPMTGVSIDMQTPELALLEQGDDLIGRILISGPAAGGHSLFTEMSSTEVNAPIFGIPTGRLTSFFRAGSELGDYRLTYSLDNGNSAQMFVTVVPEPQSHLLLLASLLALLLVRRRVSAA